MSITEKIKAQHVEAIRELMAEQELRVRRKEETRKADTLAGNALEETMGTIRKLCRSLSELGGTLDKDVERRCRRERGQWSAEDDGVPV